MSEDSAITEVSCHHRVRQRVDTQMITFDSQGMHLRPVAIRYSWPGEPDLMASQAGLRLAGRYAGWDRRPFTAASDSHVSVHKRAWPGYLRAGGLFPPACPPYLACCSSVCGPGRVRMERLVPPLAAGRCPRCAVRSPDPASRALGRAGEREMRM